MATWQEVGIDNFRSAVVLYDEGKYRSAVSRFYYAVFSALTYELISRRAAADFRDGRATPGHSQLPGLIETYFLHFGPLKIHNLVGLVRSAYRSRIAADYSLLRLDKQDAKDAYRAAEKIFQYLGVNHERI